MAQAVRIEGLAELRRDLRKLENLPGRREVTLALKEGAEVVAAAARPLAPRRSGALAGSYRAGAAGNRAFVRSKLPYAAVHEFGGTINPRGTGIRITGQHAVSTALQRKEEMIVDNVGDAFEQVASRLGWR